MRLTMFSLGAPVNWLVCSKNIIKSSTLEILSDVFSGAKSRAKYCTSQIWQCAVIGLTAPFNRRRGPPKKVANYWMGSPFHGWFDFWMELGPGSALEEKGERNRRGRKKKKGERSECSLGRDDIFPIWPRFFPFFSHCGVPFSIEFQEWDAYFGDLRVR